jgi:hypothetical protein
MIEALLFYIVNAYPEGVRLCKLIDPISQHIITGEARNGVFLDSGVLDKLKAYVQTEEKGSELKKKWIMVDCSNRVINTLFSS